MNICDLSPIEREPSEWCRMWWSRANEKSIPRILLIGDSIAVGYSATVINSLSGSYAVDYLGTSRSINDPVLLREIGRMLAEESYQIIHVNNGLHGWHVSNETYALNLRMLFEFLSFYGRGAKLAWAQSTPVTRINDPDSKDPEKDVIILSRNDIAAGFMERNDIRVNDLYRLVEGKTELRCDDGFHYTPSGNAFLGEAVAEFLQNL